jgi:hypothetical protein
MALTVQNELGRLLALDLAIGYCACDCSKTGVYVQSNAANSPLEPPESYAEVMFWEVQQWNSTVLQ